MSARRSHLIPRFSIRSASLLVGTGILLLAFGFYTFVVQEPNPKAEYSRWLAEMTSPALPGKLEQWLNKFGIDYITKRRVQTADLRTEFLLHDPDYSLAVASELDYNFRFFGTFSGPFPVPTTRPPPITAGRIPHSTYPIMQESLHALLLRADASGDPDQFRAALQRVDDRGLTKWQSALLRNAVKGGAPESIEDWIHSLREFEANAGIDSEISDALSQIYQDYSLSDEDWARRVLTADKPMQERLKLLEELRPIDGNSIVRDSLRRWNEDGFTKEDWEGVERILENALLGDERFSVFVWLGIAEASAEWREAHREFLADSVESLWNGSHDDYKTMVNVLLQRLASRDTPNGVGWDLSTRRMLSKLEHEPHLNSWIDEGNRIHFMWYSHSAGLEKLFDRSFDQWKEMWPSRATAIRNFIDSGHFGAVCALIEMDRDDLIDLHDGGRPQPWEKAKTLQEYLQWVEGIGQYASAAQVKHFIRLNVIGSIARKLQSPAERELARAEILKAVEGLKKDEVRFPHLIEQSLWSLMRMDDEIFEAGRPLFDAWKKDATPQLVLEQMIRDEWKSRNVERQVWRYYFSERLLSSEIDFEKLVLPMLQKLGDERAERLSKGREANFQSLDQENVEALKRVTDFLNLQSGELGGINTQVARWWLSKLSMEGRWKNAATWTYGRVADFKKWFPGRSSTRYLQHELLAQSNLSPKLSHSLTDSTQWVEAVLSDPRSGELGWPKYFPRPSTSVRITSVDGKEIRSESPPKDAEEYAELYREKIAALPLRHWVLRSLLNSDFPSSGRAQEAGSDLTQVLLDAAGEDWLKAAIREHSDQIFDLEAFETDMAKASPAARRYFFLNPIVSHSSRHVRLPSGDAFGEEEKLRMLLWKCQVCMELLERRESIPLSALERSFRLLQAAAESHPGDPAIQSLCQRLQQISFDPPWDDLTKWDIQRVHDWQTRLAPYAEEIAGSDPLDSVDLPITERVWKLVRRGDFDAALRLMERAPGATMIDSFRRHRTG